MRQDLEAIHYILVVAAAYASTLAKNDYLSMT